MELFMRLRLSTIIFAITSTFCSQGLLTVKGLTTVIVSKNFIAKKFMFFDIFCKSYRDSANLKYL